MSLENSSNKDLIPPQYKGLPRDIVEELWTPKVYVDPKKTEEERLKKEQWREMEKTQQGNEEAVIQNIKNSLLLKDTDYSFFTVKNGETDIGVFWYEYRNNAAKILKDSNNFEWGKERIYFDIPLDQMMILKDLCIKISQENKIAIGFKHLDIEKTDDINLKDDTTRFVANYASIKEAKRFYEILSKYPEYAKISSDRNLDYHGYNIDGVAHYASGYREKREPLKRIIETAKKDSDGKYWYMSKDGERKITITEAQFNQFKQDYKNLPDSEMLWENG